MPSDLNRQEVGTVAEYLSSLLASPSFGPQAVYVKELEGADPAYGEQTDPWPEAFACLDSLCRNKLYSHQAAALDLVRAGNSVITATPTASGKSLIYNLSVFEHLLAHPDHHALYLFPLKALAQDQLGVVHKMCDALALGRQFAAIYDGDTSQYHRKKIRDLPPAILITNPDMLHLSMLGYQQTWGPFWSNLSHVVLDEVHVYRGVFGSHMAWVLRRMQRLCRAYGNDPTFIMSSATVGNPASLAHDLLGQDVSVITESGAPTGKRTFVFFDPHDSPAYAASQLLEASLKRGLRTIVYTQSRKITELISMWTAARLGEERRGKLTAYRAGFLPEERREIEAKLASGELLGVVSTSALELGIDIGELEICILVGYPGSIMATWQRGGRVGRRQHESLIILVGQEDALDQHFMRNPDDFFRRRVESAVLNPHNQVLVKQHLVCAAAEIPLKRDEELLADPDLRHSLDELVDEGKLLVSADGGSYHSPRKYPQRGVQLRGEGNSFAIRAIGSEELLGEVDGGRCFKECHPGAIFLQRGKTLLVEKLDLEARQIWVNVKNVNYFTRARSHKDTEILEVYRSRDLLNFKVSFGRLKVTDQVTGYQRFSKKGHKRIGSFPLELPATIFETEGLWLHIPAALQQRLEKDHIHFMGGIHALEHAVIGVFPLLVLCDRNDVGGISIPFHPQVGCAAVFIYDGHSGGIGLCRQASLQVEDLLRTSLEVIMSCPCETGCPSCVHSPKCGSGNRPIDKEAAGKLLDGLLSDGGTTGAEVGLDDPGPVLQVPEDGGGSFRLPAYYVVFDLETKRSAAEVGGWHRAEQMGISVGVVYDSKEDRFFNYLESEIDQLVQHLQRAELVVGFNNKRFDNRVLSAYTSANLASLPTLDILEEVKRRLGYRLSLDRLAENTLGVKKSADGLQALRWYKQGRIKEIADYCRKDVEITRNLLLFGVENGYLLFNNKAGQIVRCVFGP